MNPASPRWETGSLHKPCVVPTVGFPVTSQNLPTVSQQLPTDLAAWRSLSPNLIAGISLRPGAWVCAAGDGRETKHSSSGGFSRLGWLIGTQPFLLCSQHLHYTLRVARHTAWASGAHPLYAEQPTCSTGCNHPKRTALLLPWLTAATHPQKTLGDTPCLPTSAFFLPAAPFFGKRNTLQPRTQGSNDTVLYGSA